MAEEPNTGVGRDPLGTAEDLQRDSFLTNFDDLGQRTLAILRLDHRQFAQADVFGANGQNVADDRDDLGVQQQVTNHLGRLIPTEAG